jgi:hypothetical protein
MVDGNYASESLGWERLFINMEQQKLSNTSGLTRESGPRELTTVATQCRVSMAKIVQSQRWTCSALPCILPLLV